MPPQLRIVQNGVEVAPPAGSALVDLPVTQNARAEVPSTTPWGTIATVAAIVVAFAGLVVWQRARRDGRGAVGGR